MMHRATKRFWKSYWNLSNNIQDSADKAFSKLKSDPDYPSLQFKKVGKLYSARIDLSHRALAVKDEKGYIWVWIGKHDEYEQLITKR